MNFAHNLFLLLFNLSQLHSRSKILELFVDGMNEAFKPTAFKFIPDNLLGNAMEVKTGKSFFGFISISNESELSDTNRSLIHNAVQMLAVILERLIFDERIQEEKLAIKELAEKRHEDLQKTIAELNKARNASLNLIEDLSDEIEKRKQSEKKLKESEERYRLILENSLDAILLTSPDGSIYSANRSACEMFGMTEEEICTAGRNELVDLDDPNLPRILKQREQKGQAKGELRFKRKTGAIFPAEISAALYYNSHGELRNGLVIRDISERKQAENLLLELKDRLENEVTLKTQELRQRVAELERFQQATIEREFRIKELRDEISLLKSKITDTDHESNPK